MAQGPGRGRPSLAKVAQLAGVSTATVSRVVNGYPGVADQSRRTVLAALDLTGYRRRAPASGAGRSLVGVILPPLATPVFTQFAHAISSALARHEVMPVLCAANQSGVHEAHYLQMLLDLKVAGVVYVSGQHADTSTRSEPYRRLRNRGLPVVLVNGYRDDIDATFVSIDDDAGLALSFEHLVRLGHRRIGLAVGAERYLPVARKTAAFRRLTAALLTQGGHLGENTSSIEDLIVIERVTVDGGHHAALELVGRGCTAVICGSDLMALGAIQAVRSLGLDVPRDVSVVGSDDIPLIALTDPPLTTVRPPIDAMAEAAVLAVVPDPAPATATAQRRHEVFRPTLVVRRSTAPPPHRGCSSDLL